MPSRLALAAQARTYAVRCRTALLVAVLLGLAASQAFGLTITVDGDASDWGIAPGPWGQGDWKPLDDVQGTWPPAEDDHKPGSDGGRVIPGWGGQTFDAEAMYFTCDDVFAYFSVVTGLPPDGARGELPGDIALDIGLGGGWSFAIETIGDGSFVLGGLYTDVTWANGYWAVSSPTAMVSGTLVWAPTTLPLCYSFIGNKHYFIETAVPLDVLPLSPGQPTPFCAHWTQTCGNDAVDMTGLLPVEAHQPEPTTLVLLGGALVGLIRRRRRR